MQTSLKTIFGSYHGLDEKSVEFLTKALERSNLPGFDYLEFKQSLLALSQLNMDEATAMRSAFATAATVGLTKEKLLKTAEHYKGILNAEKEQFDMALQKQMQQKVQGKLDEVEKLRKQIDDYRLKIQQLQEKISSSQAVIDKADEDIRQSKEKIEQTRENFESTWQSIQNQINQDVENINRYL